MTIRQLASVAAAVAVGGCGSEASSSSGTTARGHTGRPYELYTHCGIAWPKIDGDLLAREESIV